jgi:hypothetical protein
MSVFFIISVVHSVFDTPFSRNIGLAEKVGNVPGFRRQAEDVLHYFAPHPPSGFFFFLFLSFLFFSCLKPKT